MKKYTTAIASQQLKVSDFSIINNEIVYKDEGYLWIYNVPKNTIAKLMQIDYDTYLHLSKTGHSDSISVVYPRLFIKDPNGTIVPLSALFMNVSGGELADMSTKYYYFNENWSIGIKVVRKRSQSDYKIDSSQTDLHVDLYFMLEYDSETIEIEERLNSLSSRVALLESKINS